MVYYVYMIIKVRGYFYGAEENSPGAGRNLRAHTRDKKYIGRKLIDELVFMQDTLTQLKRKIKENGTEEEFIQGKQNFVRESTALKSYNTTVQRYSTLYKQLTDLMPKSVEAEKSNAVYDFLKGGSA